MGELVDLRRAAEAAKIPKSVSAPASRESDRLERMDTGIPEYSIGVSYLEFLVSLPRQEFTDDNPDIALAEKTLELQHYGLKHVKERILEYLAVKILCNLNEIILTDLKMEKMDGIQLLESAKRISPNTEIVMITGYATVSSSVDALKKGAALYLPKPIDLDELRATVR